MGTKVARDKEDTGDDMCVRDTVVVTKQVVNTDDWTDDE